MSLAKGPESLSCSARRCVNAANWAILWSNPAIHYGRHKTWLACDDHRQFLIDYLGQRQFPVETLTLEEFLVREGGGGGEDVGGGGRRP